MHQQMFIRQYGITSLKPESSFGRKMGGMIMLTWFWKEYGLRV